MTDDPSRLPPDERPGGTADGSAGGGDTAKDPAATPPAGGSDGGATTTPDPPKPPEGKTETSDKFGGLAELAAYASLQQAAVPAATKILARLHPDDIVLVVDDPALVSHDLARVQVDQTLTRFGAELTSLKGRLESLSPLSPLPAPPSFPAEAEPTPTPTPAPAPGAESFALPIVAAAVPVLIKAVPAIVAKLPAITSAIGSAAALVGMFKTDAKVTSPEVHVAASAFAAIIADRLATPNDGPVVHVALAGYEVFEDSPLLGRFQTQSTLRDEVARLANRIQARDLDVRERTSASVVKTLDAIATKVVESLAADKAADAKALSELGDRLSGYLNEVESTQYLDAKAEVAAAAALIADWDAYATALTAAPATGEPLLVQAARAEQLRTVTVQGQSRAVTHILRVTVASAKAEATTSQGLFIKSGEGAFAGGTQIVYTLTDPSGRVIASDSTGQIDLVKYNLKEGELVRDRTITLGLPEKKGGGWFWS